MSSPRTMTLRPWPASSTPSVRMRSTFWIVATVPPAVMFDLRVERVLGALAEERRSHAAEGERALGGELAGPRLLRLEVRVVVDQVASPRSTPGTARSRSACAPRGRARRAAATRRWPGTRARPSARRAIRCAARSRPCSSRSTSVPSSARQCSTRTPSTVRQSAAKRQASCAHRLASEVRPVNAEKRAPAVAAAPVGRVRDQRLQLEGVALRAELDDVLALRSARSPGALQRERVPAGAVLVGDPAGARHGRVRAPGRARCRVRSRTGWPTPRRPTRRACRS